MVGCFVKTPFVLLDDATPDRERVMRFSQPLRVIAAHHPNEVSAALGAVDAALASGWHVAGWMSYELGYSLERRLTSLERADGDRPLLWLGVFDAPREITLADLNPVGRAYAGPLHHEWNRGA